MTLYLKYRPQTFADVVGQDHIVTVLEQAVNQNQVAHAFLFCGTRGTGKTSIARILAKEILTQGMEDSTMKEQILKGVEDGSLVDLIEIDAASNTGVDNIRDLIEKIQFSPVVAKAKVYIIDEVHMLSKGAFNALLKTLEEPPIYAYFILATTELTKVPETVQSRCQRFPFRRVREEDLIRRLQFIADTEKITVDRAALRLIARHATGSFRDAISLLDQLRSLPKIDVKDVQERIGETNEVFLEEIMSAIEARDRSVIPDIVERIEDAGLPLDQMIRSLLMIIRDRMHEAIERKESIDDLVRMLSIMLDSLKDLRLSPVPGLVLETTLYALMGSDENPAPAKPIVQKKTKKEVVEEKAPEVIEESPAPMRNATIQVDDFSMSSILRHWPDIVKNAMPASVRMSLKNGTVRSTKGDRVIIAFSSVFHRDKVATLEGSRAIEELLQNVFKRPVRIECVLEEAMETPVIESPKTDLVEAAEEVFGTI